jgi:hypothetical protein
MEYVEVALTFIWKVKWPCSADLSLLWQRIRKFHPLLNRIDITSKAQFMNLQVKLLFLVMLMVAHISIATAQETKNNIPSIEQIRESMKSQLPTPPEGFMWNLYKNAVFLKPIQWHEKQMASSSLGIPITVFAVSPEEFSTTKQFEMGLTVEIISGSKKSIGLEAKKIALVYLKPILETHKKEDILIFAKDTPGDFERTFFRYRDAPPGLKPIIVHKFILANNVTDSVHVFTFESPVESWKENWANYGDPILSKVTVIPSVPPN